MLENKSKTYHRLFSFLIIFISVSCSTSSAKTEQVGPEFNHDDESWLSDVPCKAPCWYGLEPGKTSKEDVLSKVKGSSYIVSEDANEQESIFYDPVAGEHVSGQAIWFKCKKSAANWCVYMRFKENILYELLVPLDSGITLESAVEKIGKPDGYAVNRINAETKGCSIALLWQERQMEIRYYEKTYAFGKDLCDRIFEGNNQVPPKLAVQEVHIMNKDLVTEIINSKIYMPWNGFIPDQ